jgi:hypothetical protein
MVHSLAVEVSYGVDVNRRLQQSSCEILDAIYHVHFRALLAVVITNEGQLRQYGD